MPPLLSGHSHYGMYEKRDLSSEEDEDDEREWNSDRRPPPDPNSRISEIGFLLGSFCVVGGFILLWTHFLMNGPTEKFAHAEAGAEAAHGESSSPADR